MATKSILWGIDLGTTNSAIAVQASERPTVVESKFGERTTPSAVYFSADEQGRILADVGKRAKDKRAVAAGRVASRFKRYMGDPDWRFVPDGLDHTESAEDLSARVLRELINSLKTRAGLPPLRAAVITVPAAFEQPSYEATGRAARSAGIAHHVLLPEPVAAALAYGFGSDTAHKPIWLAYDLGGGTFDAALVRCEDGVFSIIDHEGNRALGGSDLDDRIVEEVLLPKLAPDLRERLGERGPSWESLLHAAEQAKCALSVDESTMVEAEVLGERVEIELHAREINPLQVTLFGPTLELCRRLLQRNGFEADDIEKVILVGGPTLSPFLQRMIQFGADDPRGGKPIEGLGIELDSSVDPLTAVAAGAAVYAAGKQLDLPDEAETGAAIRVEVRIPARVAEEEVLVAGSLTAPEGDLDFAGWSVVIERLDVEDRQVWESAPVAVAKGKFATTVRLEEGRNRLRVRVFDATGAVREVAGDRFETLRSKIDVGRLRLPRGVGVANVHGTTEWFFEKGTGLPAEKTVEFKTTVALEKGSTDSAIVIPVVEGSEAKASLNREVGELRIGPEHAPGIAIPKGSALDVTIRIDESQHVTLEAYLDDYGVSATGKVQGGGAIKPDPERLRKALERTRNDVDLFGRVRSESPEIERLVHDIEERERLAEIERLLERGSAQDPVPWQQAWDELLEMARALDPHFARVDELLAWQPHFERCEKNVRTGMDIVAETSGHTADWLELWNQRLAEYREACANREFERSERLAFGVLPGLFLESDVLKDRTGGMTDSRPLADKTSHGGGTEGTIERR